MAAPFKGSYPITAGYRYSSGKGHFAYDYGMGIGTSLYAVGDGTVAECNDGVQNNSPGYNPGSNSPSNYVLLWTYYKGEKITVYYQHMSPGLSVKTGQKVSNGQLLGKSGNTGNSTGPHLHIATQYGHTYDQYRYMDNDGNNSYLIYPPDQTWVGSLEPESEDDDVRHCFLYLSTSEDFAPGTAITFDKESSDEGGFHGGGDAAIIAPWNSVGTYYLEIEGGGEVKFVKYDTDNEKIGDLGAVKDGVLTIVQDLQKGYRLRAYVVSGKVTSARLKADIRER